MHAVAADAVDGVLDGGGLREQAHGSLGSGVGRGDVVANQAGHAGDVDDGAAAGPPQLGDGCLGAQEDALGVDRHGGVPVFAGGVLHPFGPVDAGVVHQDIQLAEARNGSGHGILPRLLVGHVQVDEETLTAQFVDLRLDLASQLVTKVADDDLATLLGEQPGLRRAHAARSPADECYFVFQAHDLFSLFLIRRDSAVVVLADRWPDCLGPGPPPGPLPDAPAQQGGYGCDDSQSDSDASHSGPAARTVRGAAA